VERYDLVTFLSDYGLEDPFVGLCHGVIARASPSARIVDLTHAIAAQDVRHGAVVLADCLPALGPAVHLAVVDPGVGTARRAVIVRASDAVLVGPDNGLLWPAAVALGGPSDAFEVRDRTPGPSRTFDGRDVFAPAAGRIAAGVAPEQLGAEVAPGSLVRLELPRARLSADGLTAEVLTVDRYGNAQLAATAADLDAAGIALGAAVRVNGITGIRCATFAEIPPRAVGVLPDAFGRIQVAIDRGRAADRLGVASGDVVRVAV
jgi:S-adenosylmethionine hydrolase